MDEAESARPVRSKERREIGGIGSSFGQIFALAGTSFRMARDKKAL
jgi:hypothetical protein